MEEPDFWEDLGDEYARGVAYTRTTELSDTTIAIAPVEPEIDATAMISGGEARTATGPNANWAAKIQAVNRPKLAYVSGQVAPAGRAPDLAAQVSVEMEQVLAAVQGTGLGKESVRKLHVFFTPDSVESRPERLLPEIRKAAAAIWGSDCPVVTAVCMVGVPGRKGGIEIDAIAG